MTHRERLTKLAYGLLDDAHGITEAAWDDMVEYLREQGEFELIAELNEKIRSCNGRRYIV